MRGLWSVLLWLVFIGAFSWMVWAGVQNVRHVQEWEVLIQMPSGPPVPPWEVKIRYPSREVCEAFRVFSIQHDLKEGRSLTPLVCQGRYSWWELIQRSSPRAKRTSQ
jgi:hypothetical protein